MSRGILLVAALALTACPTGKKCTTNADCTGGQVCSVMSGTCVTGTGTGGGIGAGGGIGTGGGTTTGGGTGTGGGSVGGGSGMNNGAETCAMAMTITAGTLMGDSTGLVNDYDPGCTGGATPGPDAVYKISVPAGQRLTATATPEIATMGNQFDLAVYLIEAPATNCSNADGGMELTCLSASDNQDVIEAAETAGYFNASAAAVDVFVVVDSYFPMMVNNPDGGIGASNEGRFALTTTIAPPAAGDRCDTAIALVSGTPLADQNLANFGDDYTSVDECVGSTSADATYQIDVAAGQLLTLTVTPSMMFDPNVSVSDGSAACGTTCLTGVDVGGNGGAEVVNYKNTTGATQSLFVVVDGYQGSTGTFSIAATVVTPPADDVCAAPIVLTPGTALTAQTIANYSNDYGTMTSTNCGFSTGVDRTYSVVVPNGQRVTITATPTAMANPSLSLVDGAANCGTACVANGIAGALGAVETLAFTNRTGASKTYLLIVDFSAASAGTFDLLATVAVPPADDVCEMPTAVTAGTPVMGTTVGYTNDYQNGVGTLGCASTGATGLDRVYQISVPANQRGVVTVTPELDGGFNPSLNLVEGAAAVCSAMPRTCVAGVNNALTNLPETVTVLNTTGAAKTYFAIVDSAAAAGTFSLGYTTGAPGANDTCTTNAATLTAGTLPTENLTGFINDYPAGRNCLPTRGPDRVYRVSLAPNQRYTATVTPTAGADGGFDPIINFIAGPASNCENAAARACRGGADDTFVGGVETGSFTNSSGAQQDVFVVVADWSTNATNRDFSLLSAIAPVVAGETCAMPQVATAGMLPVASTVGFTADVVLAGATGCASTGTSSDRVYSVTIPAMQTLTVIAAPDTDEDLIINIIDGPASTCEGVTMCAASADTGLDGDAETATFRNTTAAPKTVFVQIAGYQSNDASYTLNIQIQ